MRTKNVLIFLVVLFFGAFIANAQETLKADAGENQHFCFNYFMGDWFSVSLGRESTASGGVPPYTYRWWANDVVIYFMDNGETAANPDVTSLGGFTAYVEVKDAVDNVAIDSIVISVSEWPFLNIIPFDFPKKYYTSKGDSVWLEGHGVIIGKSYTVCQWEFENGLEDINVCDGFWVKPDVTTHYDLIVTDNYGCSEYASRYYYSPLYKVYVDEIGVKNYDISDRITFFPNPFNDFLFVSTKSVAHITIIDISGNIIYHSELSNGVNEIPTGHFSKGIYFVKVQSMNASNHISKIVRL